VNSSSLHLINIVTVFDWYFTDSYLFNCTAYCALQWMIQKFVHKPLMGVLLHLVYVPSVPWDRSCTKCDNPSHWSLSHLSFILENGGRILTGNMTIPALHTMRRRDFLQLSYCSEKKLVTFSLINIFCSILPVIECGELPLLLCCAFTSRKSLQCFDAVGWAAGKAIRPVKNWVVGCWCGYLSWARCRLAYAVASLHLAPDS